MDDMTRRYEQQPPDFFTHFPSLHSDEAAELEWLSEFVDDTTTSSHYLAPSSQQQHLSDTCSNNSSSSSSAGGGKSRRSKRDWMVGVGGVRRCSHCESEKTPQWRSGPLGPKTLCNACGVRFKSGRLVPEYRPAASPTFILTQHSNSHRKVLELRRQKELMLHHHQQHQHQHHQQQQQQQLPLPSLLTSPLPFLS